VAAPAVRTHWPRHGGAERARLAGRRKSPSGGSFDSSVQIIEKRKTDRPVNPPRSSLTLTPQSQPGRFTRPGHGSACLRLTVLWNKKKQKGCLHPRQSCSPVPPMA